MSLQQWFMLMVVVMLVSACAGVDQNDTPLSTDDARSSAVLSSPETAEDAKADVLRTDSANDTDHAADRASPIPGSSEIWFDDLHQPLSLSAADNEALMQFVTASLTASTSVDTLLPAVLANDREPRLVFISVSDSNTSARVAHGAGMGIVAAIDAALAHLRAQPQPALPVHSIKLDIVQEVQSQGVTDIARPLPDERSLAGLAFERGSNIALLPELLVAATLVDSDQVLRPTNIVSYLEARPKQEHAFLQIIEHESFNVYRFTTTSLFTDGSEVVPLYRGHRLFEQVTSDDLLSAARAGGAYLVRAVRSDGQFVYSYRPKSNIESDKYNILRHAGTIYAMLELYETTGDEALLDGARDAIGYLVQSIHQCETARGPLPCVVEDGEVKLGGNALAIVALAEYTRLTGDEQHRDLLLGLGRWIQSTQNAQGEFTIHKQTYPDGEVTDFVSRYYPGEALLALNRLYDLYPDEAWLDSAEAGARYLITVRDGDLLDDELPSDHWLLYALNELYRERRDPLYLEHAFRIANNVVRSQNRDPAYLDWYGSFYRPPRSTPTATRMEGLCAAYHLARDFEHPEQAAVLREAMDAGVAFGLQTQFRPESVMYVEDPQRTLGGFHRSLTNFEIRIDYVQHNISALLCVREVLNEE